MDRYLGNRKVLQYLTRTRDPREGDAPETANTQLAFNEQRFARALTARSIWPYIIPLQFIFDVNGRANPYSARTPEFNDSIMVLGAVHNLEFANLAKMNVSLNRESTRFLGLLGTDDLIQLDAWDFAGHKTQGAHYFPQPLPVGKGETLNVSVYKVTTNGVSESRYFCFIAQRVLANSDERVSISAEAEAEARAAIIARSVPEFRVFKIFPDPNDWIDLDGAGNNFRVEHVFPERNEPLLIRGFRSDTMVFSRAEIFLGEENFWTTDPAPVWAFTNEDRTSTDATWQMLEYPFLLFRKEMLTFRLFSSGTDEDTTVNFDNPAGRPLMIDVLCETL